MPAPLSSKPVNEAYIEQSSQRLARQRFVKPLAMLLLILLLLAIFGLVAIPWQQNIVGKGEVMIYSPMNRPQTINAQITARIQQWHVAEGDMVEEGQLLLTLGETKTDYLDPQQLERLKQQRLALANQQSALNQQLSVLGTQLASQVTLQQAAVPAARLKIAQAEQKVAAAAQKLAAAKQEVATAQYNLNRRQELFENGLRSKRDLELAELTMAKADAGLRAAEADVSIAQQEMDIASFSTDKITAETTIKQQDVQVKQGDMLAKVAKLAQDIAKIDNKIANIEQRSSQREILATVSGQVTRVLSLGQGETVKENMPLLRITPKTNDLAAALYVADWNVPLLKLGREVRLQFAGFPAVQFVGWPGVAKGSFAGRIAAIDAADNGTNYYRVLVRPDKHRIEAGKETEWPDSTVLRPGSQVIGWIILDTVPLWFEVWRQFNGFQPTVGKPEASEKAPGYSAYGLTEGFKKEPDPFKDDASALKVVKQRK
jgi:multidrug efflux pump subunit AcrA (membrane-fusion protein)